MKLFSKKKVNNPKVETLDKKHLSTVIGGTDEAAPVIQEGKKGLNAVNVKLA
jgi:hypothetical protein